MQRTADASTAVPPLLEVRDLVVEFGARGRAVAVVDNVSLLVNPGEIVGLVGESGSGKSVTILSILRLIPPPGRIASGEIRFRGRNVRELAGRELRRLRGDEIALIPPDAAAALNPLLRTGNQVTDGIRSHRSSVSFRLAAKSCISMFERVGIPNPKLRFGRYPHELSGGMQQRALIASALLLSPALLLADEPTTALDVTIQAQILQLLLDVREQFGTAILFVTHDLASVSEICDRVLVMYAGHIVEMAPTDELFSRPAHPYTDALIGSIPSLGSGSESSLRAIAGAPPESGHWPKGCRFAPRCPLRSALRNPDICESADPPLVRVGESHQAACHFANRSEAGGRGHTSASEIRNE